jgi:hypothetical protein
MVDGPFGKHVYTNNKEEKITVGIARSGTSDREMYKRGRDARERSHGVRPFV